ncbi:MAG: hypothetical protein WCH57_10315 [Verrucomicrobiota bacterium]
MRPLHANPASWLALLCVLASAGLWVWSRRIPPSAWETTAPLATNVPAVSPAASDDAPGEEPPPPSPAEPTAAASPGVSPTADTPAVAVIPSTPPPPTPSPTPSPSDAELAGPLPQHSADESAAPTPQPAASAPPAPPAPPLLPTSLDLASLSRQPERWPRQVVLLAAVRFPVILKGVNAGNIQVPAGSPVLLRKVNPDGSVEIELPAAPGSIAKVKAQNTDLLARAGAAANPAPATPSSP